MKKRNETDVTETFKVAISDEELRTGLSEAAQREASRAVRRARSRAPRGWTRLEGRTWRRYYRVRDAEGKSITKSIRLGCTDDFPTFAAVRAAGDRAIEQIFPQQLPPGASPPWRLWVQRFLDTQTSKAGRSTQDVERCSIVKHLLPAFESLQLHEITAKILQKFIDDQHAMRREDGDRLYRPKTLRDRVGLMHRMLKAAKHEGLAAIPIPMSEFKFPKDDRPYRTVADRAFTEVELEQILAHAADPWLTLYRMMLLTGLRVGEAVALQWSDVHWHLGAIDILKSASRREPTSTKTRNSAVRQPMPPELATHLQNYRRMGWRENPAGYLFPGRDGDPLDSSGIGRYHLRPLLAELGIRARATHAFRHSFGMRLGRLPGVTLARLAKAMRCTLRAAEMYISATDADARAVIDAAAKSKT